MGFLSYARFCTKKNINVKTVSLLLAVATIAATSVTSTAAAVDYNTQIKNLQNQNAANQSTKTDLQTTATTLEGQISSLQRTLSNLSTQISVNQAEQARISQKIAETQAKIAEQQHILAQSVRKLYIENDMSMLEMMASSKNLSEYVDREQYTISAQASVKEGLDRINSLKAQEQKQKDQVDQLLEDNKTMQSQTASQKSQLDELLAMNQSQQAQYSATIAANNSQISQLQKQQAAENAAFLRQQAAASGPTTKLAAPAGVNAINGANYPYANAPWPNDIPDPWGMYQRQCVSYTAWAVSASGRHMPYWGGFGNAKQWDDNARADGIPVDGNPRAGDVAVRNTGTYGHVMYVDSVNSDGSINISQYNSNWNGRYSTARIFPGDLVFIHF